MAKLGLGINLIKRFLQLCYKAQEFFGICDDVGSIASNTAAITANTATVVADPAIPATIQNVEALSEDIMLLVGEGRAIAVELRNTILIYRQIGESILLGMNGVALFGAVALVGAGFYWIYQCSFTQPTLEGNEAIEPERSSSFGAIAEYLCGSEEGQDSLPAPGEGGGVRSQSLRRNEEPQGLSPGPGEAGGIKPQSSLSSRNRSCFFQSTPTSTQSLNSDELREFLPLQ